MQTFTQEIYIQTSLWMLSVVGVFIVVRLFLAPLLDLISQRAAGILRLAAFIFTYSASTYKIIELLPTDTASAAVAASAAIAFSAAAYKPIKQMVTGDILKATGILKEGDYITFNGRVARITEIQATHTILTTSDLRKTYIPNDQLLTKKFTNMTKSGAGVLTVKIKIDTRKISVSDAKLILLKTGTDIAKGESAPNRAAEVRVEKIEGDMVTLRLTLYLLNPAKAEPLASHIMERVYAKLTEATVAARTN